MNDTDSKALPTNDAEPPCVEVAVTIVRRGGLLLTVFNQHWESYTLPMTKRRYVVQAHEADLLDPEPWADAATRNLEEWFGQSNLPLPQHLMTIEGYRQSDRDLVVKDYHFEIFAATADDGIELRPGAVAEWLTPDDFRDVHRRPISPTARHLIDTLDRAGKLS